MTPKSLNPMKLLLPGILSRQTRFKHAHKWKRHHKCTKKKILGDFKDKIVSMFNWLALQALEYK